MTGFAPPVVRMKRSLISVGIVLISVVTFKLAWESRAPTRAAYQGRGIEEWFKELPLTVIPPPGTWFGDERARFKSYGQSYGSASPTSTSAAQALAAMGTNALPYLLEKLQGRDSGTERVLTRAARETGVRKLPFRDAELERLQAVSGLIELKTLTPEAWRVITGLTNSAQTNVAVAARYILTRRAERGDVPGHE